ncbi:MAG: bifunctional hydroxymethylpyrimidine kinase/phosphomethylpyrimidine kinase [Alphaproteobacteria bacterium]|nr:bifunctional hydroxymethylpyrimidine kinase/phosphomethylpyrimidine kinase [Alphaproteobacteria bacterium]
MTERVLTVAESDSSGASGVQADIKTIMALGGYAAAALSAITAQDTRSIRHMHVLEPSLVVQQMRAVLEDVGADAIKTGYLINEEIINAVADVLDEYQHQNIPVVVDPSIVLRNGGRFMGEAAIAAIKRRLLIRAAVLTPDKREAELLTGMTIRDIDDMRHAADMMRTLGAETVLLKAGQAVSDKVVYLVATADEERIYERQMLKTRRTLGAGCTLSSAITVSLAQKFDVFSAIERALDFMHQAMLHAPAFGGAAGPMNHAFDIEAKTSPFSPGSVKVGTYS